MTSPSPKNHPTTSVADNSGKGSGDEARAERILIVDYGSQYTQLIARRVREAGVYCEIQPWNTTSERVREFHPRGIILSGSPESVNVEGTPRVAAGIFDAGVPLLGICYGMQVLAAQLGGQVAAAPHREYGHARVRTLAASPLLDELNDGSQGDRYLDVWMSHGDRVEVCPPGFVAIAESDNAPLAAIADEKRRYYGLQFHPEVTHTRQGQRIIERFVHDICGCARQWNDMAIVQEIEADIAARVGEEEVVLALSGGVDSSVVALLLHRVIGRRLTCVFVDNGLLRLNEGDQVMETFASHLGVHVVRVRAERRFLDALKGVADPEAKRKVIGETFIRVFEEEAHKLPGVRWLAQGTIYPDVIESAGAPGGRARVIKSHHNVGGLPERMHLKLLEPLRMLFKDEVRRIGLTLGLPAAMINRHPFPGPGLGVRILGAIEPGYADILRQADAVFIEELRKAGYYERVSQAFAVFLPVRSVGVVGDGRAYEFVIALRAVETVDFMTANWAHLPHELLGRVSNRIINEVRGVSRVVYDISGKPPATIEWE